MKNVSEYLKTLWSPIQGSKGLTSKGAVTGELIFNPKTNLYEATILGKKCNWTTAGWYVTYILIDGERNLDPHRYDLISEYKNEKN